MCSSDIFLGLIAILFPPLAVWVKRGICSADSLINICLCMLGFIPGLLHAWYIIAKFPDPAEAAYYEQLRQGDSERGDATVTYYYVNHRPAPPQQQQSQPQREYGTVTPAAGESSAEASNAAENSTAQDGVPPSYADAVKGDHKVQGP